MWRSPAVTATKRTGESGGTDARAWSITSGGPRTSSGSVDTHDRNSRKAGALWSGWARVIRTCRNRVRSSPARWAAAGVSGPQSSSSTSSRSAAVWARRRPASRLAVHDAHVQCGLGQPSADPVPSSVRFIGRLRDRVEGCEEEVTVTRADKHVKALAGRWLGFPP